MYSYVSRLDYGFSSHWNYWNKHKLQCIQNRAVRLIYGLKRRDYVFHTVLNFTGFFVNERMHFNIFHPVCAWTSSNLSSVWHSSLFIYQYRSPPASILSWYYKTPYSTYKSRLLWGHSFHVQVAGSRMWNLLPQRIRETPTLTRFKKLLKSHFFPIV